MQPPRRVTLGNCAYLVVLIVESAAVSIGHEMMSPVERDAHTERVVTQRLSWVVLLLSVQFATGCSANPQRATEGDCSARIRYDGTIYRPHNLLNQAAPIGKLVGNGDIIGCGGLSAATVATVRVYAVEGVDLDIAVMTDDADWHGVFVAEGVPRSTWPTPL